MTQPIHTPGPLWIDDDGYIAAGKGDEYVTVCDPRFGDFDKPDNEATTTIKRPPARRRHNAFDSAAAKLGCNAVELAERMADGGVAELIEALNHHYDAHVAFDHADDAGSEREHAIAVEKSKVILAKVRGAS